MLIRIKKIAHIFIIEKKETYLLYDLGKVNRSTYTYVFSYD
jgi:hypothetical protein